MRIFQTFILIVLVGGCGVYHVDTVEELQHYVLNEGNGAVKQTRVNGIDLQVIYRPTDLLAERELRSQPSHEKIDAVLKKYTGYYYFVLNISKDSKEVLIDKNDGSFGDLISTLSFRMADYVTLTTQIATIPVSDFIFDRTYGYGAATSILFVFDKKETLGSDWIQLNIGEFGMGLGNPSFRFLVEDLENVPRISFVKGNNK
jgi:hypothetical protein